MTGYKKKLIEVALPLVAINRASAHEKSIRSGHPSTLHLWWARRPLAAARAVIFSQMVDDPSGYVDELRADAELLHRAEIELEARLGLWNEACARAVEADQAGLPAPEPGAAPTIEDVLADLERQRLFRVIEDLVRWENTTNETVLRVAREEIFRSWQRTCVDNAGRPEAEQLFDGTKLPAFHDPFAGGGTLPLEAQRLGLESYASDLNPVAVLINKAMIEIPPKFAGRPPVNPESLEERSLVARGWKGAEGLAEDVRHYGQWMRHEAEKRIGHLYPTVEITSEMTRARPELKHYVGQRLTVISWLWARTVKSPNPAYAQIHVPLASTFMLSSKSGKEAYVEPVVEDAGYRFTVKVGEPRDAESVKSGTKLSRGANFQCLMSRTPIPSEHIYAEANAGRMGARLMAVAALGNRERVYLAPTPEMEAVALTANPTWSPEVAIPENPRWFSPPLYGLKNYGDLFTPRQLVALTTFSDLAQEARERARADAISAGMPDDRTPLADDGTGASAYADAVAVYLGFNVSKFSDLNNNLVTWKLDRGCPVHLFGRQAIPMVWDYAEANPFSESSGSWDSVLWHLMTSMTDVCLPGIGRGFANQLDAATNNVTTAKVVSTDPPYYDNIGYADLSDFFYFWLRRSLQPVFPELFSTIAVPKTAELIASPYRHGGKARAEQFYMTGMTLAMERLAGQAHPAFPVTIYYAFRQSETQSKTGTSSTGWEKFLEAIMGAGFAISGTWPMRTEMLTGLKSQTNSLASSIVLVCRKRAAKAPLATRREFVAALGAELPIALARLQRGNIAPVDLAQASIGPGMAVFSGYSRVVEADGSPMSVRAALGLINQALDEILAEQEGEFDADTRWSIAWFEQFGSQTGEFGVAETLSKAKGTSVNGMVHAGILEAKGGRVRLLRREELEEDWDPTTDRRLTVWEMTHHLVRRLEGGESAAASLAGQLGSYGEIARDLAYRLYLICERKKWSQEALAYNALVVAWPQIQRLAAAAPASAGPSQTSFEV